MKQTVIEKYTLEKTLNNNLISVEIPLYSLKTNVMTKTNPAITRKTTCFDFENTDIFEINSADTAPLSAICHKNIEIKTTKTVKTK